MPTEVSASAGSGFHMVSNALKRASEATGAGYDFLKAMAARESSFDASAKAATSSAAGLFQFIDQTWLGAVKQYGARHGLADFAADITRGTDGKFTVADKARRDEILNLRFDAGASAALAGELANENRTVLEKRLGRAASSADLYTAHFLGPSGAVKLLSAASNVKAADLLPAAANANKAVFYDGARAKSVGEVVASIAKSMGEAASAAPNTTAPAAPAVFTAGTITPQADDIAPARRARIASVIAEKAAPSFSYDQTRLSALAWSALQAIDPARLASDRNDNRS